MSTSGGQPSSTIFQAPAQPAKPQTTFDLEQLKKDFSTQRNNDWTIPEAYMCILFSAAMADGMVTAAEHQEILALAARSRVLKSLDANALAQANQMISYRLATRSNGMEEACQCLPIDMRLSIFAHAVDIILVDGDLATVENDFLAKLTVYLGLKSDETTRIMEVLLIKNRF